MLASTGVTVAAATPAAAAGPGSAILSWGDDQFDELGNGTGDSRNIPGPVSQTWPDNTSFTEVAAGGIGWHTLAVASHGELYSWGDNSTGQLGDGTTTSRDEPVPVQIDPVAAVAAGGDIDNDDNSSWGHSLAATADGRVLAWGANSSSQLGLGDFTERHAPTHVQGALTDLTATAVAAGYNHSLAVADGNVYAWGANDSGQIGNGLSGPLPQITPVEVQGALAGRTVTAVAAGEFHSLALTSEGEVYAWGTGDAAGGTSLTPTLVQGPITDLTVTSIAASSMLSVAVTATGEVYTWGSNLDYALGYTGDASPTPQQVGALASVTVTDVAAGDGHSLALTSDGTLYAWGRNDSGQLGDGTNVGAKLPEPVHQIGPAAGAPVTAIAAGFLFSVAIAAPAVAAQGVLDWGWNCDGQLGNHVHGESHNSNVPVQPSDPTLPATSDVAAGYYHTLAVTTGDDGGHVYAWGNNNYGQVGQPPSSVHTGSNVCVGNTPAADDYVDHPTEVGSLSNITQVAGGQFHSLALETDGTIWAWGSNARGQLGDPTFTGPSRAQPQQVHPTWSGTTPIAVAAGDFHSMALMDDGTVWAWGDNSNGELGNGNTASRPTATQVQGLDGVDVKYIATGIGHGMAASDTALYTWGLNNFGQLGDGSTTGPVLTAQQVTAWPADTTITAIAAGSYHSMAIGNGDIYTWGAGASGRLCDSGLTDVLTPTKITAAKVPHPVKAIAGGGAHSLAIGNDYQPYACGANDKGQLGTGDNTQYTTLQPVAMTNYVGQSHTQVAAGADHSITR